MFFSEPMTNDDRMPMVNHLVDDLHKRLNELENLYSTVSQSSDARDLILKQYIEQIFTDIHMRITNNHQQQEDEQPCQSNTTVVVAVTD